MMIYEDGGICNVIANSATSLSDRKEFPSKPSWLNTAYLLGLKGLFKEAEGKEKKPSIPLVPPPSSNLSSGSGDCL